MSISVVSISGLVYGRHKFQVGSKKNGAYIYTSTKLCIVLYIYVQYSLFSSKATKSDATCYM